MNLNFLRLSGFLAVFLTTRAATQAADVTGIFPDPNRPVMALAREASEHLNDRERAGYRAWKWSLAPVIASQALDAASSWNMRELNPALAGGSGRFDATSAALKLGATGALIGAEFFLVKKHPGAARALAKLNWSSSAVTTGFAVHNFAIR